MKNSPYESELFFAYIGTPKSFHWYKEAFEHYDANDGKLNWYWNTWAMLGGFWFFLYRKQTKIALIILFVFLILATILPPLWTLYATLFAAITMGGFGTYPIYTTYHTKIEELQQIVKQEEKALMIMKYQIGGINRWAIPTGIFALVSFILIVAGLAMVASKGQVPTTL